MSKYKWVAEYSDGETKTEAKDVGYHHIDRTRLRFFSLMEKESGEIKIKVEILPKQQLIWRRRYALHSNGVQEIVHLIGKQVNKDGKNHQWLALIFEENGKVEFFNKYDPNNIFLNEVELLDFEK